MTTSAPPAMKVPSRLRQLLILYLVGLAATGVGMYGGYTIAIERNPVHVTIDCVPSLVT